MTREQKIEAFSMRLDGATYEEIGRKFGVSRQCIEQMIHCKSRKTGADKCIYKGLSDYMADSGTDLLELSKVIGSRCKSTRVITQRITGERKFNIEEIKAILALTNMTFEECFSLKAERKKEND